MKIPFLSRLMEIKERQLELEEIRYKNDMCKIRYLHEIKEALPVFKNKCKHKWVNHPYNIGKYCSKCGFSEVVLL